MSNNFLDVIFVVKFFEIPVIYYLKYEKKFFIAIVNFKQKLAQNTIFAEELSKILLYVINLLIVNFAKMFRF